MAEAGITLRLGEVGNHEPQRFFQGSAGLWVAEDFLATLKPGPARKLRPRRLFVRSEIGHSCGLDGYEVCARIAQLIRRQQKGEEGDLLTAGCSPNLFPVQEGVLVDLFWNMLRWGVRVVRSDGRYHWGKEGCRVFSPD